MQIARGRRGGGGRRGRSASGDEKTQSFTPNHNSQRAGTMHQAGVLSLTTHGGASVRMVETAQRLRTRVRSPSVYTRNAVSAFFDTKTESTQSGLAWLAHSGPPFLAA